MGDSTCAQCIYSTLDAIWTHMGPEYLGALTGEKWVESEREFRGRWNFPHCVAAIDGKHVQIQCPRNSGSTFYNYKGTYSTLMLALVDAKYRFLWISVGSAGKEGDAGIFASSDLGRSLAAGALDIPPARHLPGTTVVAPHVLVGDEAFPLKTYLMKPFGAGSLAEEECRIYNYRLSRARRVVENAFGILMQRFRCFRGPLQVEPQNAARIVRAACVLHNYLREKTMAENRSNEQEMDDAACNLEESAFAPLRGMISSHMYSRDAGEVRNTFKAFFSGPGAVPWQS